MDNNIGSIYTPPTLAAEPGPSFQNQPADPNLLYSVVIIRKDQWNHLMQRLDTIESLLRGSAPRRTPS